MNKENLDWGAGPEDMVGKNSIFEKEKKERLESPAGGKVLVCKKSFGGFNVGDYIKTSNKNGEFKIKLFDSEKNKLVKDEDWIEVNTGEDFEDFSGSFIFKKEEKNIEPIRIEGDKEVEEDEEGLFCKLAVEAEELREKAADIAEMKLSVLDKEKKEAEDAVVEKVIREEEKEDQSVIEPEATQETINEKVSSGEINKILEEFKDNEIGLKIEEKGENNFVITELPGEEYVVLKNISDKGDVRTISRDVLYNLNPEEAELRKAVREEIEEAKSVVVEKVVKEEKKETEKAERRWNNLEDFLKRDVESLKKYYNKSPVKELAITSIKDNMESYTVNEEHMKSFLEMTKIKFTEENKERLSVLASKLYGDLLRELEKEPEIELKTEAEIPEDVENPELEKSEEEKRRDAENLEGEKTARESRDKMRNRVTEIGKKIADNPEMPVEKRKESEDKRSMETVSSVMFEVNLASYEDPKKKRRRLEDAVMAMETSLKEMQVKHEREKIKLTKAKKEAVEKFGIASDEEIEEAVLKFKKDNQQAGEQEEKSKFGWLKEKLGIGGENIEEMKEKISEATNLEDLAEVADLINGKYNNLFNDYFKEALRREYRETLREYYNNDDIDGLKNVSDENRRKVLLKFYEKLDELLKEKEEGEDIGEGDIMRDFLSTEEIEKTPEIEISEIEEVSEEVKKEIRKAFEKLGDEDREYVKYNFNRVIEGGYSDREVLSLWTKEIGSPMANFLQDNKEIFERVTAGQMMKIIEENSEEIEEGNDENNEKEELSKEDVEKEINTFLERDELNIENVENLKDLEDLLDSLEVEVKNIKRRKIPNELTRELIIVENKIEDNHFTYCLEDKDLLIDSKDIKENFSKDRNLAKDFKIDSLKKYYLKLLDKVEKLYNIEKGKLAKKQKKKVDIGEALKEIAGGMGEASIKEQEELDTKIRVALKNGKRDEVEKLQEKYYNHFEERWSDGIDSKRYRETYHIKNELKKSLGEMEMENLKSLYDDLLEKMEEKNTIEEEVDRLSDVHNKDIEKIINKTIDFEKVKILTVKEVKEAIESVYKEKRNKT